MGYEWSDGINRQVFDEEDAEEVHQQASCERKFSE
jgi:hypothetical protein